MPFTRKDLLGIRELSVEEITTILDTAESFKEVSSRAIKKVPALRGKTVINLFFEASTRTRTSFEIAAKRLSADAVNISASTSSVSKGESLIDTAQNLQAMAPDAIVIRHPSPGVPHQLSRMVSASIINGGDGAHEHPTQALLDAFTIREHKGRVRGLQVAIVGDIMHSRVARSNAHLLTKLGAHVRIAGPRTLIPIGYDKLIENSEGSLTVGDHIDEAIAGSDVVMMLRIQRERMTDAFFPSLKEYSVQYGLTLRRLELAASDCIVMHPGPVNRGIEISSEVVDSARSLI
ncbi:MAG TPA: aspartate carbamoyltransferase catalytic subunit, partial [Blastocatellia bacterium]|nr:aspartate carbamoyltransferase catalytic subunit [Blastocatellia bacterium]